MINRPRRLRANSTIRDLVRETSLSPNDFIYPIFVVEGTNIKKEISSLEGCFHYSVDRLYEIIDKVSKANVKGVLLFGIPEHKDFCGSESYNDNGIVQRAVRKIKELNKDLYVITDVCMCEYTDHGHCGILNGHEVDNDKTLEYLAKISVSHAKAGADMIAPSDMMDGRVSYIRNALDKNGFSNIPIMSYSAKFCSAFYGPFRDAADSAPKFGDRKSYQMDPANRREALKEVYMDIEEGADIVMVKPALPYLDIIREVKNSTNVPVAAYSVSGEYAMIKAGAKLGVIDEQKIVMESLTSIKRAGADIIITYYAIYAAKLLMKNK